MDQARARRAAKRPEKAIEVTFEEEVGSRPREVDLMVLDAVLEQLAKLDPKRAQMVELRFFGGLTLEEAASVLGVSLAKANRQWRLARAWLQQRVASTD